jgi:hypothetical protein
MSWPHRIGAIIQVLTGQIKPPHSVPDTYLKLATGALFLLSALYSTYTHKLNLQYPASIVRATITGELNGPKRK